MKNETEMEHIVEEALEETIAEAADADELEHLRVQVADLSDKYIRAMAELENTRRRAKTDTESIARARAMIIAENFLPLIDAIGAAFAHSPDDDGIKSLAAAANSVLVSVGIIRIETIGQKLNPQFHNAVSTEEKDGAASGTIICEFQPGYMFGDAILRPAMVVVAK